MDDTKKIHKAFAKFFAVKDSKLPGKLSNMYCTNDIGCFHYLSGGGPSLRGCNFFTTLWEGVGVILFNATWGGVIFPQYLYRISFKYLLRIWRGSFFKTLMRVVLLFFGWGCHEFPGNGPLEDK